MRAASFSVPGAVPPKSNYRHDGSEKMRRLWRRIKEYESEVGAAAMVAGSRRHMGRGKVWLRVRLLNQVCDLDNALKCPVDGLKHVAIEDDSPEHVRCIAVLWAEDAEDRTPRAEYRIEWEGTS